MRAFVRSFVVALALASLAVFAATADASALYCERRIVSGGDTQDRVLALCGEPASMATRVDTQTRFLYARGIVVGAYTVSVRYDVWVYDFGPTRLMVELVFEDGTLARESTLGYGTNRR